MEVRSQRDDNSMENLCLALLQFLSQALQDVMVQSKRVLHATAWAKSMDDICNECDDMVFEKIEEWSQREDNQTFYNEAALLEHKQMFDIMQFTKEGYAKENTFLPWCRKAASLRALWASTATDHAEPDTATEHAQSSDDPETCWMKPLALILLCSELLPEQKNYKIRRDKKTGDIQVTSEQRSWINHMLRKNLGHAKLAFFFSSF